MRIGNKAVFYTAAGRVNVTAASFDSDGNLIEAVGTVEGEHVYTVHIDPTGVSCSCRFGQTRRDAAGHSHDLALRLQAANNHTSMTEYGGTT